MNTKLPLEMVALLNNIRNQMCFEISVRVLCLPNYLDVPRGLL